MSGDPNYEKVNPETLGIGTDDVAFQKVLEAQVRLDKERSDKLTTPSLATKTTHTCTSVHPPPSPTTAITLISYPHPFLHHIASLTAGLRRSIICPGGPLSPSHTSGRPCSSARTYQIRAHARNPHPHRRDAHPCPVPRVRLVLCRNRNRQAHRQQGEIGGGAKRRADNVGDRNKGHASSYFRTTRVSYVATTTIFIPHSNPFRDSLHSS